MKEAERAFHSGEDATLSTRGVWDWLHSAEASGDLRVVFKKAYLQGALGRVRQGDLCEF